MADFETLMRLFMTGNIIVSDYNIGQWRMHNTNATILEANTKYEDALNAYINIADFAIQYLSSNEIKKWHITAKD